MKDGLISCSDRLFSVLRRVGEFVSVFRSLAATLTSATSPACLSARLPTLSVVSHNRLPTPNSYWESFALVVVSAGFGAQSQEMGCEALSPRPKDVLYLVYSAFAQMHRDRILIMS